MNSLFESPAMTFVSVTVLVMEILSILFLAITVWEFWRITQKHHLFHAAIQSELQDGVGKRVYLLWLYGITTLLVGLLTTIVFIFHPHIL